MMKYYILFFIVFVLSSCRDSQRDRMLSILKEWEQKEILFPSHSVFTIQGNDTVEYHLQHKYKIVTYVDSLGCISCKLHLSEWKKFIYVVDSLRPDTVQFLFFFSPKKKREISRTLLEERFKYPICIDEQDSINVLNHFPSDLRFQTFLLDRDNKVIAIGNPIHNSKIKELYLKIISGEYSTHTKKKLLTSMLFDKAFKDLETFNWEQEQLVEFKLTNTGDELLVIDDISTSCGCTTVEYSKEPVQIGKSLILKVKYRADHPEHFNKTITVYCNTKDSPLQLKISGNAK